MKKLSIFLKTLLVAIPLMLGTSAWADNIEKVSQVTMTWMYDQFVHNGVALQNPANEYASLYLNGLYLAVQNNSTAGARKYTAARENVTAITKSSHCTNDDVTASGFTTGNYMALTANAAGTLRYNTAPSLGTGYSAFGFRTAYAGTIYALVKGTNSENDPRTITLYDCTTNESGEAVAIDQVTPTSGWSSEWYLLKGTAVANGIYQIMSSKGNCTVLAIKFIPSAGEAAGKQQYTISMTDGVATFSCANECAVPTGCKAYIASSVADGKIKLTEVTQIPANTGVILKADDTSSTSVTVKSKVTTAYTLPATNKLVANIGAYALPKTGKDKTTTEYTNYILVKDNGKIVFAPTSGEGTIGAHKAYLHLTASEVSSLSSSSRGLILDFDDESTGIKNSTAAGNATENKWYTLEGMEIEAPIKSGIYIRNAKKVILK
jgi:hypothetical protein